VEGCHYGLYLPNAISPSRGDGLNDYFCIPELNQRDMVLFEISIFNRWGEMVFYSNNKSFKWNGEYRGEIQYQTIYNYVIKYTDTAGRPYRVTGSITIL
jgi:gliding motility-associated-like protein